MKIKFIAIINKKGGVGKSTTTLHLAQALTDLGKKVVVIDGDKLRSGKKWNKRRDLEKSFPVMVADEASGYTESKDIVIFDTAAAIEDATIEEMTEYISFFIIPTDSDGFEAEPTVQLTRELAKQKANFGVLINRSYGNHSRAEELKANLREMDVPYFDEIIPRSALIPSAMNDGRTVGEVSGGRTIADKYKKIAVEILDFLQ